jgi:uncharacterized protein YjbI with pentapeptide repeats
VDQRQQPSKQIVGDPLLKRLGIDPRAWPVVDRIIALLGVGIGLTIVVIAVCGYALGWEWTGLIEPKRRTFWDWLNLLLVPVVLALGGYLFTRSENRRARLDIAEQHRQDQVIAEQRRQDDMRQAYLDGMSQLVTDKEQPLDKVPRGASLSILARARTLTVLTRLDGERKRSVLQFLYESRLVTMGHDIVDLREADLGKASLSKANLSEANLSGANLYGSTLSEADLSRANLSEATLSSATLSGANLSSATLNRAVLSGANLSDAELIGANLSEATLSSATLSGAKLNRAALRAATLYESILSGANLSRADLSGANLYGANLSGADLSEANLSGATLIETNLSGANLSGAKLSEVSLTKADLSGADLSGADLSGANLRGAKGWTEEQLTAAKSLGAATMPDGQILKSDDNQTTDTRINTAITTKPDGPTFEEWLKSKGSGENGEGSGPS